MGTWHPPPRAPSSARSAVTAARVAGSFSWLTVWCASPSSRVSMARAPCPTAGHMTPAGSSSLMRSPQPRRLSPAAANRIASYRPSANFRSLVSRFPRSGSISRSGRRACNCAERRRELVPTRAPFGSSASARPTMASRASSRAGMAATVSPAGTSVGKSFMLCTARSTRPSSSASSISFVNSPLAPTWASGTSVILSPVVLMISMRVSTPSSASRAATHLACHNAS